MRNIFFSRRPHFIPAIVAALMLLAALGHWPYGYYVLLRWIVCGAAVFVAINAFGFQQSWATWIFGIVAVLFNPLVPVHLSRQAWAPIDLITASLFILAAFILQRPEETRENPGGPPHDKAGTPE